MNDQSQSPEVQIGAGDHLFHSIIESLVRLEAQHERMSERVDGLCGMLQEFVKQKGALEGRTAIISSSSVIPDAFDSGHIDQAGLASGLDKAHSISTTVVENLNDEHARYDSDLDLDDEKHEGKSESFISTSKAQNILPQSSQIDGEIDTRAYKLVDQVIFGKKLLNLTTNIDAKSWLVTMAKDLFDKGIPLRQTRLCLHFFAAMLEPETLTSLKTTDTLQKAEEEAKAKAMLFCIQLHVGYSELEKSSSQPKLVYGIPSEYVTFTEKHLNNQKTKRAAWKNKQLRQAIEAGNKLEMLRLHMGPGIIYLIPTRIWLEIFPQMTIDNIEYMCEKNQIYIPNFKEISVGPDGCPTSVNAIERAEPYVANGQTLSTPGLFLRAVTEDVIKLCVYSLQELFHHANDIA